MQKLIGLLCILTLSHVVGRGDEIPPKVKRELANIFANYELKLQVGNGNFATQLFRTNDLTIEWLDHPEEPPTFSIFDGSPGRANVALQLREDGFRLKSIYNIALERWIGSVPEQRLPKKTMADAISIARTDLKQFGVSLPDEMKPIIVRFNRDTRSCWHIFWARMKGPYPWDNFVAPYREEVYVVFHEEKGIVSLGYDIYSPEPKALEVKIGREAAITKAEKCVPLIQRTPYYQQARIDGFVATGLVSCDLKIAVPNWLLDPKRAVWLRDKPPAETRLCWVVRFSTVDSKAGERGIDEGKPVKLVAPEFLIYIDAATGEVVGANFT